VSPFGHIISVCFQLKCVQVIGVSKQEMEEKRPLAAQRYESPMTITGISQLHSSSSMAMGLLRQQNVWGQNIPFYSTLLLLLLR
jgi:hypothetical protein